MHADSCGALLPVRGRGQGSGGFSSGVTRIQPGNDELQRSIMAGDGAMTGGSFSRTTLGVKNGRNERFREISEPVVIDER